MNEPVRHSSLPFVLLYPNASSTSFSEHRKRNAPSPDWERALCLSELASLGKEGEGLGRRGGSTALKHTPAGPVPHPSGLSLSVATLPATLRPEALSQSGEGALATLSTVPLPADERVHALACGMRE